MTGTYTDNGDGTSTVDFSYTGETQKVRGILGFFAERVYVDWGLQQKYVDGTLVPFDQLTDKEKLDIVDWAIRDRVIVIANSKKEDNAAETARDTEKGNPIDFG